MRTFLISFLLLLSAALTANKDHEDLNALDPIIEQYNQQILLAESLIEADSTKARKALDQIDLTALAFNDSAEYKIAEKKINFVFNYLSDQDLVSEIDKLIPISLSKEDSLFYAQLQSRRIELLLNTSKFKDAIELVEELVPIYDNRKLDNKVGELLLKKGAAQYSLGEYVYSLETVFLAADKFKDSRSRIHLAFSYLQIGTTYLYLEDFEKSINNYELARTEFIYEKDTLGVTICDLNIALSYLETERYDTALIIYKSCIPTLLKTNRVIITAQAYHNIGNTFLGLLEYDSARYYYGISLKNDIKIGYNIGISSNYAMISELNSLHGETDSSIYFGENALNLLEENSDFDIESRVTKILAENYNLIGNYKKSVEYYKWYLRVEDSLKTEREKINQIAKDEDKKIEDYREKLISANEREEFIQEEIKVQKKLIIGMSIFGVIMVGLLILVTIINQRNRKLNSILKEQQEIVENDLAVKNSLLKEIHHRVKNNLQVISSMLSIQSQYLSDPKLNLIIEECKDRINSMALIHESLYKRDANDITSFSTYIKNLTPKLIQTYQVDENQVKLNLDIDDIELSIDESVPCGLLINEVISNSLKHAFPDGKNGEIFIQMKKFEKKIFLSVSDNGIGLPKKLKPDAQDTFGFLLIYTLTSQLDASMKIDRNNGLSYHFEWQPISYEMLS